MTRAILAAPLRAVTITVAALLAALVVGAATAAPALATDQGGKTLEAVLASRGPVQPAPRVINGTPTTADQWVPGGRWSHLVFVLMLDGAGSPAAMCGGSLIAPGWVLTAAHCVQADGIVTPPSQVAVIAGHRSISAGWASQRTVAQVVVRPDYDEQATVNDAALLRLTTAVPSTEATPIPLVGAGEESLAAADATVHMAGWGNRAATLCEAGGCMSAPGDFPDIAEEASAPVQSDAVCGSPVAPGVGAGYVAAAMLCAGRLDSTTGDSTTDGTDTCQGDSGGPLIAESGSTRRLVGITSWGIGCGSQYYGVYARVSAYRLWVQQTIGLPIDEGTGQADACSGITALQDPRDVRVAARTLTTITFRFAQPLCGPAPDGYDVWFVSSTGFRIATAVDGPGATSMTVRGLLPGRPYTFNVDARSGENFSNGIDMRVATLLDLRAPSAPGAPVKASATRTSVTFTWKAAGDNHRVTRYVVQRKYGSRWRTIGKVAASKRRFTVGSLRRGTATTFRVRARDWSGNVGRPSAARAIGTRR